MRNNTELVKSLYKVAEGINEVIGILEAENKTSSVGVSRETEKPVKKVEETVEKVAETESNEGAYSREELDAMKYNDLKKLGKSLGVKCNGTRNEIVDRILNLGAVAVAEESVEEEEVAEETESKEDKKVVPLKKKKAEKEEEIDEEFLQMAREVMEDNSKEDILDILEEAGIKLSAKQKKDDNALMTEIAKAIANGILELDDDEEEEEDSEEDAEEVVEDSEEDTEEEEDTEDEESSEETDFSADSYFPQFDPNGYNDPNVITEKRAKAIQNLVAEIIEGIEKEEITVEDIESELGDIVTDEESDLLDDDYSEEDLVAFYIEMKKRFVDDDGNVVEQSDPYEVNGDNFCCGHELKYSKKNKQYVCEICGETYEAE